MGWGDEEKIEAQFPWEKTYIRRENFDGSTSIHEEGLFGGLGEEVGRETRGLFGGYTDVASGGGSTTVYDHTFFGPDLHTSEGVGRALSDAAGNAPAPRPGSASSGALLGSPSASDLLSGSYGGYGGGYAWTDKSSLPVGVGTFVYWILIGALSALIPCIFAASYTWGSPGHPHYLEALKALALIGGATCLVACVAGAVLRLDRGRLSSAIVGGAVLGTILTVVVNSYLNWKYAQPPVQGHLQFPLAVWLIVPAFVVGAVPVEALNKKYGSSSGTQTVNAWTFAKWGVLGALSAFIPVVFAASYTWIAAAEPQFGDALRVLVPAGLATGLAACAIGASGRLTRERLSRSIVRGVLVGTLATIAVASLLNWRYAELHDWTTRRLWLKVWLSAPASADQYGHASAVGHLTFPAAVWFIVPACVLVWVGVVALRSRRRAG